MLKTITYKTKKDYEEYLIQKSQIKPSVIGRLVGRRLPLIPVYLFFKGCNVLDVGCAEGIFLKLYKNSVGVDTNRHMVEACLEQGLSAKQGTLENLSEFEDESFDGVFLSHVLEHIADPDLDEVYRVLSPGGKLVVEVPINKAGYESNTTHVHLFTPEELNKLVSSSKFEIKKSGWILPFYKEYIHNHYRIYAIKK